MAKKIVKPAAIAPAIPQPPVKATQPPAQEPPAQEPTAQEPTAQVPPAEQTQSQEPPAQEQSADDNENAPDVPEDAEEAELPEAFKPYLDAYPNEKSFHMSSDGQVFLGGNISLAKDHQKSLDKDKELVSVFL